MAIYPRHLASITETIAYIFNNFNLRLGAIENLVL